MGLYFSTDMEPDQNPTTFPQNSSPVSFPTVNNQPKKSGGAKTLLIIGILILVGILGFVIYKSATNKTDTALSEPTPFDNLTAPVDNPTTIITPTPTATIKPADRSAVSIEIQNGTGITGEAAYLQTQLKALGYTKVTVGNAGSQTQTATVVTFSDSLSSDIVTELTQTLNSLYQTVTTKTSTTKSATVLIVTGLRKGATAKPSTTSTPSASPSATPST
jgi:hypothetical protein